MNSSLTAMEGSCIEIKCISHSSLSISENDYWFWLKDANWTDRDFVGTVIFSSNETKRPVDPEFKNRVNYIKSLRTERRISELYVILICDLRKTDSGLYRFRFVSEADRWSSDPVNLTVQGEFKDKKKRNMIRKYANRIENYCGIVMEGTKSEKLWKILF